MIYLCLCLLLEAWPPLLPPIFNSLAPLATPLLHSATMDTESDEATDEPPTAEATPEPKRASARSSRSRKTPKPAATRRRERTPRSETAATEAAPPLTPDDEKLLDEALGSVDIPDATPDEPHDDTSNPERDAEALEVDDNSPPSDAAPPADSSASNETPQTARRDPSPMRSPQADRDLITAAATIPPFAELPRWSARLDLTPEQLQKLVAVSLEYATAIQTLRQELAEIEWQREQEWRQLLSEAQRRQFKQAVSDSLD